MWTRLEHTHCLETINNMWFLGKRESVNAWKKAHFDGFREKDGMIFKTHKYNQCTNNNFVIIDVTIFLILHEFSPHLLFVCHFRLRMPSFYICKWETVHKQEMLNCRCPSSYTSMLTIWFCLFLGRVNIQLVWCIFYVCNKSYHLQLHRVLPFMISTYRNIHGVLLLWYYL
jgi:hypothetical protein